MKAKIAGAIVLLIVSAISGLIYFSVKYAGVFTVPVENSQAADSAAYKVVGVVDGDTIDVLIDGKKERVRYIGMDTPETVDPYRPEECFGKEASKRNSELVLGKEVRLEKDVSERDEYGRLLRYVYTGDMLVNLELVSEGYATLLTVPPDVAQAAALKNAERTAREKGLGLWKACA